MQQQQPVVTDVELIEALARRRLGLPAPPSQPFTVHDVLTFNFNHDPSHLYTTYGGGGAEADSSGGGCVYFFSDHQFTYEQDGWKVAAGTQQVLDGGGAVVVGYKDTLAFHEGRWLPRTRWAMDEFYRYLGDDLRLYRLRRLDAWMMLAPPPKYLM